MSEHVAVRDLTANYLGSRVVFADGGTTVDGVLRGLVLSTWAKGPVCYKITVETESGEFELKQPSLDFEIQFPALAAGQIGGEA